MTRREWLAALGSVAAGSVVSTRIVRAAFTSQSALTAQALPLTSAAGVDRVVMLKGKTYLNGWAGYGEPPRPGRGGGRGAAAPPAEPPGPPPTARWSKVSGPGTVTFADPRGRRHDGDVLGAGRLRAEGRRRQRRREGRVDAHREGRAAAAGDAARAGRSRAPYAITSPMWASRIKALIVNWIPHCIDQCNRTDLVQGSGSGAGGIDNFIEAGKALRGEPHGKHKGYVFSNAWVHQTVESMCLALMVDPQGDARDHRRAGRG